MPVKAGIADEKIQAKTGEMQRKIQRQIPCSRNTAGSRPETCLYRKLRCQNNGVQRFFAI